MFVDYYALLEIEENATQEEIKQAFRQQAIKWHPDRNKDTDTTVQMQRINEAYLILKDSEARRKFDSEYQLFKRHKADAPTERKVKGEYSNTNNTYSKYEYQGYTVNDNILQVWITNARKQAINLAQETIRDFKGMAASGIKEGVKASGNALLGYIIFGVTASVIVALVKSCS